MGPVAVPVIGQYAIDRDSMGFQPGVARLQKAAAASSDSSVPAGAGFFLLSSDQCTEAVDPGQLTGVGCVPGARDQHQHQPESCGGGDVGDYPNACGG